MADIADINAAQSVKIIGAGATGIEQTPVKSSLNGDLATSDILDAGGVDTVIGVTTTPVQAKVGGSALANRKYVVLEAQDVNVKWGFSNSTQNFNLFRNQTLFIPVGPNTAIWLVSTGGTRNVSVGEVA